MGLNICGQNIRITYENDIPVEQIKINKNKHSQKIQLHWALYLRSEYKDTYENDMPGRQIKINKSDQLQKIQLHWASVLCDEM